MVNKLISGYAPPCAISDSGNFNSSSKYYDELLNYIKTGLDNERAYLRSCRAFKKAELSMQVLYGDTFRKDLKGLSNIVVRKSRRQAREAIANQSDIRQNWQIRTTKTDDAICLDQADDLNNLSKHWWNSLFVDRKVKGAQQYSGGQGTGYMFLWPDYDPLSGDIDIIPHFLNYKSVLVGHIPDDDEIQNAYRVDVRLEMPLPMAHKKFPDFIETIKADTEIPSRMARGFEKTKKAWRGLWKWKEEKNNQTSVSNPFPSVNIFYTFIDDQTINETSKTICMGEVDSHWYYEVPSFYNEEGEINKVGTNTYLNGEEVKRYLNREDCKLYPNRRLIISCSSGILYDGPPQWGDGTIPVSPFYFDKVAGEFLGFPVIMDSLPIENSINNMLQAMEDAVVGRINPPIGIDSSIPQDIADKIKSLGTRGLIGKAFQYSVAHLQKAIVQLVPAEYYTIDSKAFELVNLLQSLQDYVSGTQDWASSAQLKQMPAAETQEALLQKLGVLTTDQAREQEKSFMYLGRIWLSFADQVYTVKKRLQILGKNAIKPTYIDYDPTKFEQVYKDDSRPKWIVRREHMKNFAVYVSPNSVQERQSTQNKLASLQLAKMGNSAIPDKMMYDLFVGDDQFEKRQKEFFEEQLQKAKHAATIQAEVQKIMQAAGVGATGNGNSNGVDNPMIQQVVEALSAKFSSNVGRPPDNETPARLESKMRDGIPDSTLVTSNN
jgi:hypothetical protein